METEHEQLENLILTLQDKLDLIIDHFKIEDTEEDEDEENEKVLESGIFE